MDVLKRLQEVKPNKPYNGFAKLCMGFHLITNFRFVKNKFGKKSDGSNKSILVELKDEVLFLPQYFCQNLSTEDIQELNSSIESNKNVYLYFEGKQESNKYVFYLYLKKISIIHSVFIIFFCSSWIIKIIGDDQKEEMEKQTSTEDGIHSSQNQKRRSNDSIVEKNKKKKTGEQPVEMEVEDIPPDSFPKKLTFDV